MEKNRWYCSICDKSFQRQFALEKHYSTRIHEDNLRKDSDDDEIVELRKELEKEKNKVRQLTFENDKLKKKLESKTIYKTNSTTSYSFTNAEVYQNCTINNVNNINNIQLNLSINPHGSENWEYLKDDIVSIMKCVNTCIPEMVKRLHFDENHPENHNIKFPNKKLATMKTYDGEEWKTYNKKDVVERLIMNLVDKLEEEYGCDFRNISTKFIQDLWENKIIPISTEQRIDRALKKEVEYSILDGQNKLKTLQNSRIK